MTILAEPFLPSAKIRRAIAPTPVGLAGPATLLRANNHARAVYLSDSDKARVIVFDYHPPVPPTAPPLAALMIGLSIAGLGAHREKLSNFEENDKPDTIPKPNDA